MMLLRRDGLDVIAIPQPSHAWLSGQIARDWGNEHFAAPTPYDEVCLAAGQHDIGWLDWAMTPALDVAALDRMSLEICWGVKKEIKIPNVPTAGAGTTELCMQPRAGDGLVLDDLVRNPWPFRTAGVALRAEGKRLRGRFATEADLHRALDEAEAALVTAVLHKA